MKRESKGRLAGLLGASCCVVPLVLIAVGLGGSVLTVFPVRYKAYLMTAAALALGWAWYACRRASVEDMRRALGRYGFKAHPVSAP